MLSSREVVARYYVGYYNRAPDPAGFEFWVNAFENGVSTLDIANFFADQVETRALYPFFADPDSTTPEAFITSVYQNLFNRDPDPSGLTFWTDALTSGGVSTGQMIEAIIAGATTDPDFSVVQNKVAAGIYWEDQANNFSDFEYTEAAAASASGVLDVVTDSDETVPQAQAAANSYFATLSEDKGSLTDGLGSDGTGDKVVIAAPGPLSENAGDETLRLFDSKEAGIARAADVLDLTAFNSDSRFNGIDGQGLTVVVIDTGIDFDHPAFGPDTDNNGIADRITFARDFTGEGDGTANDIQSHGTHVASIVGSSAQGFAGVAPGVNIIALQALNNQGFGGDFGIRAALQWVIDNAQAFNIVAVNMSLGDTRNINQTGPHPFYGREIETLRDQLGIVTIAAAGNDYRNFQTEGASTLSADPNTISVASVGGTLQTGGDISSFSQRSDDLPTILAPGGLINAAVPGGGTGIKSGTSMAAPQVAGMVALGQQLAQRELGRLLTADEVTNLLFQTGDRIRDDENPDDRVINTNVDYQRVDMLQFAEAILALRNDGGPTPPPPPPSNADTIPDNVSSTAVLSEGTPITSAIDFDGDADFFRVDLTPGNYEISLNGAATNNGTLSDPVLGLFTSTGAYITNDDDGGVGLNSLLAFTVNSGGTAYVAAGSYGSAQGTYQIALTRTGDSNDSAIASTSTTESVTIGGSVSGELEFGADQDWYGVQLTAGQNYVFDLVGTTLEDPALFLYNSEGDLIAGDDDSGEGLNARLTFTSDRTDTFYLSAEAFDPTQTGTYQLSAAQVEQSADDFGDNIATQGVLQADGGSATGVLEVVGDQDWFRVDVSANTTYAFSLAGGGPNALADPFLVLYDDAGELVGFDDDSGEGLNSQITYNALTDHSVYLAADSFEEAAGGYTISSAVASQTVGDIPGDPSSTASLDVGESFVGTLEQPGDTDWYAVNVQSGASYQFDLTRGGDTPINDPFLVLFDSVGNLLDFDDDGGTDVDSSLAYTADADGLVYISAEAFDLDTDAGTYEISVTATSAIVDDTPASPSTSSVLSLNGNSSVSDVIDQPGDTDWHALDVTAGSEYLISMVSSGDDPLNDPFLVLYDSAGEFITSDDDSAGGFNAAISYLAAADGRIFISAEAFSLTDDAGTYTVTVEPQFGPVARVGSSDSSSESDFML